jgi:hypothetical protein
MKPEAGEVAGRCVDDLNVWLDHVISIGVTLECVGEFSAVPHEVEN